jgi:ferritin-like metal-binding protein YciE
MKEFKGSAALDAGLLPAAQAAEHYEISRYGTLKAWADELGLAEAVDLLVETLEQEKKTNETLWGTRAGCQSGGAAGGAIVRQTKVA